MHAPKWSVNGEIPLDPLESDYRPSTILPKRISKQKKKSSAIVGAALLSSLKSFSNGWALINPLSKMAVSLSLLTGGFNSTKLQATYKNVSRSSFPKVSKSTSFGRTYGTTRGIAKERRQGLSLSLAATGSNQVDTDTNEKSSGISGRTLPDDNSSAVSQSPSESSAGNRISRLNLNIESSSQSSEASNGQVVSSDTSSSPDSKPTKKSPLTARERVRAARVLSRYNESSKTSKSDMGSKVLEALRESDRGKKRSRLPEAPTNLFDDSKRGMPKAGWTFEFPGGSDLFVIAFSFVFISTVMFATTYIVWKVGAIHFNEY